MFAQSIILASALAAGTMAQTTSVTSLYLYGSEGDNIVASVISAAPDETTYFVTCAPGTDGSDCGFGPGITFVNGPSTLALHVTEADAFTMDVDCKIASDTATCAETAAGPEANDPGTTTGVIASDLSNSLLPVTITAGLDKIQGGGSTTATGSSATSGTAEPTGSASSGPSETGSSASMTGKATSTKGTSTSASASASSTSTSSTSGAMAGAGQNLVLAGLAGVVGLVMAL